ncbi:antirestriction protein [Escherichia coli]|nr:antirestriction protein [Escherichia coli]ELO9329588.1 antirestriction protein [Escherichia coli]ELX1807078.1 antirestriction protein [Escherichia coli]
MKTLSQNTTASACAPETGLQQLVATIIPDEQRISFWPQHFGLIPQWVTLEPRVFGWMDRLCENYCGGIWNLMTYSHHACRTECYAMTVHYYRLRDYALQHPECSAIMRIID